MTNSGELAIMKEQRMMDRMIDGQTRLYIFPILHPLAMALLYENFFRKLEFSF